MLCPIRKDGPIATLSRNPELDYYPRAAYQFHCQQFRDEYQPAALTETQLVHEPADTAWRLSRVPLLEARLLSGRTASESSTPTVFFKPSASKATASRASSTKRSISSVPSKPTAANASAAASNRPPRSSNSTNVKESNTIPLRMASFFQLLKLKRTAAA